MDGDAEITQRAMLAVAEERPDPIEMPAGHETLADLDEEADRAYWRAVEERAALLRSD